MNVKEKSERTSLKQNIFFFFAGLLNRYIFIVADTIKLHPREVHQWWMGAPISLYSHHTRCYKSFSFSSAEKWYHAN